MDGLINYLFPVFAFIDSGLVGIGITDGPRILMWGMASGIMAMLTYLIVSNQGKVRQQKVRIREVRDKMSKIEEEGGDFNDVLKLSLEHLKAAFSLIGKVLGPSLLSSIPVLFILLYVNANYHYDYTSNKGLLEIEVFSGSHQIEIEPASLVIRDNKDKLFVALDSAAEVVSVMDSDREIRLPLNPPSALIHKKQWWNFIIGNEAGYLPAGGVVDKIYLHYPRLFLYENIEISKGLNFAGRVVDRSSNLLVRLGNFESSILKKELDQISVKNPVFISGLARSGSTILLELLSKHPDFGSHQYRDFPALYIPFFWNWFLDRAANQKALPAERAHKDGIIVSPESSEAMEEILWMKFFPNSHDSKQSNVIGGEVMHPRFENFYKSHIKKLLYVRNRVRYLSKANYHVTRLSYILKLFPDAKFVIPVREPQTHIASLVKQHKLFISEETRDPRIKEHMRRSGHFEFGLNRSAINTGDLAEAKHIESLWSENEIRGWARYWANVYKFIVGEISNNKLLSDATIIVRYEDLCKEPRTTLNEIFDHCNIDISNKLLDELEKKPRFPTYYKSNFSVQELSDIDDETHEVSSLLGYE